ncbi:helix-turn-helix domain-containing protein [Myroides odoratus]|uniref:helix-turn-helix domain-containing protein n=1 Tax=Myroides odoratus TaxID=256 RepID=UPI0039B05D76
MSSTNRKIVEFIRDKWISEYSNNSLFARKHNIDEKTVRMIKEDEAYSISLNTVIKICEARNISLQEFCRLVNV